MSLIFQNNMAESAEFWCRRLDKYERTVRLLSFQSSGGNIAPGSVKALVSEIWRCYWVPWEIFDKRLILKVFVANMKVRDKMLFKIFALCSNTGRTARPRYILTDTQIRMLREQGLRRAEMERLMGVSPITLLRRRVRIWLAPWQ